MLHSKTVVATIPAGTTAAVTFNGPAIDAQNYSRVSAQGVVAGATTPSAALKIQVSDDKEPSGTLVSNFVPTNWSDLPSATIPIAANGVFLTPPAELCSRWVRVVYVFTSGTGGTVTANAHFIAYQ